MNGILWAVLGTLAGLLAPVLYRHWRRQLNEAADSPPTALAPARRAVSAVAITGAIPGASAGPKLAQPSASGNLKRRLARRFHGISLRSGPHGCQAVHDLKGQRFLADEAPALPLPGCGQQKCQCAYSHHVDRREQDDRRSGWGTFGGFTPTVPGGNRRGKSRERRGRG